MHHNFHNFRKDKTWTTENDTDKLEKNEVLREEVPKEMEVPRTRVPLGEAETKIDKIEVPLEDTQEPEKINEGVIQQAQAELEHAAADPENADLRRQQLTMRAAEKEKVEEQREQQKMEKEKKKAEGKSKAKPKGRPRKAEGDGAERVKRVKKRKQEVEQEEEEEEVEDADSTAAEPEAKPKKNRKKKKQTAEGAPKAKAKATAKAKRAPRARRADDEPKPDEEMVQDMVELMLKYHQNPYDKTKEKMHKEFKKGTTRVWVSIYWNRPAGGVKIMEGDKESQKFYFSYEYSSVAVHIYMCNRMAARWMTNPAEWHESDEALNLFRLLLVSGAKAQEEFNKRLQSLSA
eukprot:s723_g24.t1